MTIEQILGLALALSILGNIVALGMLPALWWKVIRMEMRQETANPDKLQRQIGTLDEIVTQLMEHMQIKRSEP